MLKSFWDEKKHLIQITAFLIAIGAIFLSVPTPENDAARELLQNVQVLWLVIISVFMIVLFINFYALATKFEEKLEKHRNFYINIISSLVFFSGFYFLINLWGYAWYIYKDSIFNLLPFVALALVSLGGAIILLLLKRLELSKTVFWLAYGVLAGHLFGLATYFFKLSNIGLLSLKSWLEKSFWLSISFLLVFALISFFAKLRSKKKLGGHTN